MPDNLSLIGSTAGLLYQLFKDQHLTGAQREANAFTEQMARQQMEFESGQAQQQMVFQERMASSQWQRTIDDMIAAGVNPAVAYSQGTNVAPSGAMASGSSGSSVDPGRGLSLSDWLSALQFKKDMQLKDEQIEAIRIDNEGKRIDNDLKRSDLEWRPEFNAATVAHLRESINKLIEDSNMSRFQRQVMLPAQKALWEAQQSLIGKQSSQIDAEMVYMLWRNKFYEENHFWPSESAGKYFWNFISGLIENSHDLPSDVIPPPVGFRYP